MAMGYIDREEAMRAIDKYKGYFQDQVSTSNLLTKIEAKCIISDVDDADVEQVVHGVWEPIIDDFGVLEGWIHPECGRTTREASEYCPTCGAKMDKED